MNRFLYQASWRLPKFFLVFFVLAECNVLLTGCGGGSNATSQAVVVAPDISAQPTDQSVPMGLVATFSVVASGSNLQYQWSKNGAAIAGATESTYITSSTAFSDTGESFTVTVSNSAGNIQSAAATLTVTARAPKAGDLRFAQVDAGSTVNGYGNAGTGLFTDLLGRMAQDYSPSLGTPFVVGPGDCATVPVTNGTGCAWLFEVYPLAVSPATPALLAGYASDSYANFLADLQAGASWPSFGNGVTPSSTASVITSLDLEPADALFALSWVQSSQQSGFDPAIQTVTPSELQAAVSQAAANGRVTTAISNNGGQVTFFSYGWQSDLSTVYEAMVATASPASTPATAAGLAAQGYIITAIGLADSSGDVYIVGTRVQGDTMARPFMVPTASQFSTMQQQGYATVGIVSGPAPDYTLTFLGER